MKVFRSLETFQPPRNPAVTIGTFDGVHLGHQQILKRLKELADKADGESVLLTLWPHPRLVLNPDDHGLRLINTMDEKIALLREQGLDNLLMIPFSKSFASVSKEQFINDILIKQIQTKALIVGYDHRFGRNREGSFEDLQAASLQYNFTLEEIPPQTVEEVAVSSTKIRNALIAGDINTANSYLNYDYFLTGKVTEGRHIGSKINFPTANVEVEEEYKLIPARGVYIARVRWHEKYYRAMLNIGTRPTVDGKNCTIEAHLLDFDQNIYGETLRVHLLDRIRDEEKFSGLDELKKQLENDKEQTLRYFEGRQ